MAASEASNSAGSCSRSGGPARTAPSLDTPGTPSSLTERNLFQHSQAFPPLYFWDCSPQLRAGAKRSASTDADDSVSESGARP